ncbi:hypothetical protein [Tepidibacter mesophilus]|nr:hypothetical protein [Tepidibacter mesophilus]
MKLISYHILCIQGYAGNGYIENFNNNSPNRVTIQKHVKTLKI